MIAVNTTASQRIDLRDEIENHCNSCPKTNSSMCGRCFFASVDFGRTDLGGNEVYARAFKCLKIFRVKGFKRDRAFGNYLEIPA